jgi:hypothetical protein
MKPVRPLRLAATLLLASFAFNCIGFSDTVSASVVAPFAVAAETTGRVLVREHGDGRYRGRARPGLELQPGDAVLTGPGARIEWRLDPRGRWRLGENAVWLAGSAPGEATLRAGTALAAIPPGEPWRIHAADTAVLLSPGVWLLTAVENEGLKIVALDAGTVTRIPASHPAPAATSAASATLDLRAGEVVFAPPGGGDFSPVVTVFLDELLATSRLLTRFTEPLPQAERLRQQGAAQREHLALVSNVHVGGAKSREGFQLIRRADPAATEKPPASK